MKSNVLLIKKGKMPGKNNINTILLEHEYPHIYTSWMHWLISLEILLLVNYQLFNFRIRINKAYLCS